MSASLIAIIVFVVLFIASWLAFWSVVIWGTFSSRPPTHGLRLAAVLTIIMFLSAIIMVAIPIAHLLLGKPL